MGIRGQAGLSWRGLQQSGSRARRCPSAPATKIAPIAFRLAQYRSKSTQGTLQTVRGCPRPGIRPSAKPRAAVRPVKRQARSYAGTSSRIRLNGLLKAPSGARAPGSGAEPAWGSCGRISARQGAGVPPRRAYASYTAPQRDRQRCKGLDTPQQPVEAACHLAQPPSLASSAPRAAIPSVSVPDTLLIPPAGPPRRPAPPRFPRRQRSGGRAARAVRCRRWCGAHCLAARLADEPAILPAHRRRVAQARIHLDQR